MSKVYFETGEECEEFFDRNIETRNDDHNESVQLAVIHCKNHGYIRKNPVEEFENKVAFMGTIHEDGGITIDLLETVHLGIQAVKYLQARLKEVTK